MPASTLSMRCQPSRPRYARMAPFATVLRAQDNLKGLFLTVVALDLLIITTSGRHASHTGSWCATATPAALVSRTTAHHFSNHTYHPNCKHSSTVADTPPPTRPNPQWNFTQGLPQPHPQLLCSAPSHPTHPPYLMPLQLPAPSTHPAPADPPPPLPPTTGPAHPSPYPL